jgi:hypothetical protein
MTDLLLVAVGALALLVSALGGWPLTAGVLRLAARSPDAGGEHPRRRGSGPVLLDPPDDGPVGEHARAALRGGTWIGILERVAITACLLAGYPAGIAFVIAVKGLGRYPELRENPGVSERFVIGTLASMLWAVALGALAHGLPLD